MNKSSKFQYASILPVTILYTALLIVAQISFQREFETENLKLITALFMGILFPIVIFQLNKKYFSYINLRPPKLGTVNIRFFKQIMIGLFFSLLALYLSGFIFYLQTQDINNLIFKVSFNLAIFNILTAIGEEIIFRSTLLYFFVQKKRKYFGLVFTAVLFSMTHLLNLLIGREVGITTITSLIFAGLFLGLIYLNYGLISAIAAHYFWNLLHSGSIFSEEGYPVQVVLFLICVVLFFRLERKTNTNQYQSSSSPI